MLKFLSHAIMAVAALARGEVGRQGSMDLAKNDRAKSIGRNYWRPSDVFGTTPPLPDPGGVHAYMMRHRR